MSLSELPEMPNLSVSLVENRAIEELVVKYESSNTREFAPELVGKINKLSGELAANIADVIVEQLRDVINSNCTDFELDKLVKQDMDYYEINKYFALVLPIRSINEKTKSNIPTSFIKSFSNDDCKIASAVCHSVINLFDNFNLNETQLGNILSDPMTMKIIEADPRLKGFTIKFKTSISVTLPNDMKDKKNTNAMKIYDVSIPYLYVSWNHSSMFGLPFSFTSSKLYQQIVIKTESYLYTSYMSKLASSIRTCIIKEMFAAIKDCKKSFALNLTSFERVLYRDFIMNDPYFNGLEIKFVNPVHNLYHLSITIKDK